MDELFMHGNTSKKITVTNNNEFSINASWYVEHPNPISWMRPNRTRITDLSWIDAMPKWQIVNPKAAVSFYIYLDIPESEELLDQHWETWITFKLDSQDNGGDIIHQEYAVRIYIDTPLNLSIINNSNHDTLNYLLYPIFAAILATAVFIIGIWFYKKRNIK